MNKFAVALATDSAMSLGPDGAKIYPSAEKLFQLSDHAPVGAMVYGNAHFARMPWETIIKAFRKHRGENTCQELGEYAMKLLLFLREHKGLFPQPLQETSLLECAEGILLELREDLRRRLEVVEKANGKITVQDARLALRDVAREGLKGVRRMKRLGTMNARSPSRIRRKHGVAIGKLLGQVFGAVPIGARVRAQIVSIVCESISRTWFGDGRSGLVVAGFGEGDFMPRLMEVRLQGMALGHPRFEVIRLAEITDENASSVNAFAQSEMVYAFMEGIDQTLERRIKDSTSELFKGAMQAVVDRASALNSLVGAQLGAAVGPNVDPLVEKLFQHWKKLHLSYWRPVLDIAGSLPKDELGNMAEALVNLTKFRRRVSADKETVAGPIDVAVITKGDGFVWLRRKHYFAPELNPRVVARYWR